MYGIFLDTETTGLDPRQHAVLEIAFKVINLSSDELVASYSSIIKLSEAAWGQKDSHSIEVNGFTWDELAAGQPASDVAKEIIDILCHLNINRGNAVFICQNPSFDRSFFSQLIDVYAQEKLNWPYHWLDLASMFWATTVDKALKNGNRPPEVLSFSKNNIAKAYDLPPEKDPHKAMNGVDHLILCYRAVLGPPIADGIKTADW